jgi:hypothetical protein
MGININMSLSSYLSVTENGAKRSEGKQSSGRIECAAAPITDELPYVPGVGGADDASPTLQPSRPARMGVVREGGQNPGGTAMERF